MQSPPDPAWLVKLPANPLPALSTEKGTPLYYNVQRDLLGKPASPQQELWEHPTLIKLLRKQTAEGDWRYPGAKQKDSHVFNYNLLETYRNLRLLVEIYGLDHRHPALSLAAEYIFTCQTPGGDIRGILGTQYMPYYHAAILELLIKAGYAQDSRLLRGMDWLLSMRQHDGGWIVPLQAVPPSQKTGQIWCADPVPPDYHKPFSHLATGMVLRAFAAHPAYSKTDAAKQAAILLKGRFFQADKYNDRKGPPYWIKFQFPFWWNNLLSALDSVTRLGFTLQDDQVHEGVNWFLTHQEADGLWPTGYGSGKNAAENRLWVGLAVCRVLQRLLP